MLNLVDAARSNGQNLQQDASMSGGWLGRTAILFLVGLVTAVPARADGPGPEFKHLADKAFTSPDGRVRVEQYTAK